MSRSPRRGTASRIAARRTARSRVGAVSSPMSGDDDPPGVEPTRRHDETDLRGVEGHREIGVHRRARDLARRRVDARRHVDRDDRCRRRVDPLDGSTPPRGAAHRGSRFRRARRRRRRSRRVLRPSRPRRVRPRAGHARRRARRHRSSRRRRHTRTASPPGTRASPRARRRAPARSISSGIVSGIARVPLLGRSHLDGGVQRSVSLSHPRAARRPRWRRRSRASASSRGRSHPPGRAPRTRPSAPRGARRASDARRSRSPSR